MFLRHHPEGAKEETLYEFRPDKVPSNRGIIAEKLYSKLVGERQTWEQFVAAALSGSIAARRVALWLAITDKHPMTRFDDVPDFTAGELKMVYSRQELRQLREAYETSDTLASEKEATLAQLDREIETAPVGSDEPLPDSELDKGKGPNRSKSDAKPTG